MLEHIDIRPAKVPALLAGTTETVAGTTETVGGTLLAAGLATPLASAALTGVMTTAIRKVQLPNGPWAANGGWEYNAVLIGAVTALAETGPGELSLDHLLRTERSGPLWALPLLATGVSTAVFTMAVGGRSRPTLTDAPTPAVAPRRTTGSPETPQQPGREGRPPPTALQGRWERGSGSAFASGRFLPRAGETGLRVAEDAAAAPRWESTGCLGPLVVTSS